MFRQVCSLAFIASGHAAEAAPYSVLMVGDWGGGSNSNPVTSSERSVISGMAKVAEAKGTALTLLMGDNFYESGINDQHKDRWNSGFEQAFSASVFKDMPFYAIAGNHDHWGDVSAQVEYHQQGSGRWNFPNHWYNIDETLPDGKTLRFCMFDSVDLVGMSHMFDNGTKLVPTGPKNLQHANVAWDALETCLNNDADYLFTVAHYPTYSGSSHGSVMESTKLPGLLKKYSVSGHLAGHDHSMQHIERDGQFHVVSGAGRAADYGYSKIDGCKYHYANADDGGFAELSIDAQGAQIIYYDTHGSATYSSGYLGPRTLSPAPAPAPGPCVDVPTNWRSSEGDSCGAYKSKGYCSADGTPGPQWDGGWGPITDYADKNGVSALGACCVCGGGSTIGVVV